MSPCQAAALATFAAVRQCSPSMRPKVSSGVSSSGLDSGSSPTAGGSFAGAFGRRARSGLKTASSSVQRLVTRTTVCRSTAFALPNRSSSQPRMLSGTRRRPSLTDTLNNRSNSSRSAGARAWMRDWRSMMDMITATDYLRWRVLCSPPLSCPTWQG